MLSLDSIDSNTLIRFLFENDENPYAWDLISVLIQNKPSMIKYLYYQPIDICMIAVEKDPSLLEFIWDQTFEICSLAVNTNPSAIKYIRDPVMKVNSMT